MTYDTWKTTDPRDAEPEDPPCKWRDDELGIYCEHCGAIWEWQCEPEQKR